MIKGRVPRWIIVVGAVAAVCAAGRANVWWQTRAPYGPEALDASATVRFSDVKHFNADQAALGVTGLTLTAGKPGDQLFVGRVDLKTPPEAHGAGEYFIVIVDKRTNRFATQVSGPDTGDGSSGEGSSIQMSPPPASWLPKMTSDGNDGAPEQLAIHVSTDFIGPIPFAGHIHHDPALTPSDLMIALIFVGHDGHGRWATRVSG